MFYTKGSGPLFPLFLDVHLGEMKENVCRFVGVLVFVYVNSITFEHSSSMYTIYNRKIDFMYCTIGRRRRKHCTKVTRKATLYSSSNDHNLNQTWTVLKHVSWISFHGCPPPPLPPHIPPSIAFHEFSYNFPSLFSTTPVKIIHTCHVWFHVDFFIHRKLYKIICKHSQPMRIQRNLQNPWPNELSCKHALSSHGAGGASLSRCTLSMKDGFFINEKRGKVRKGAITSM